MRAADVIAGYLDGRGPATVEAVTAGTGLRRPTVWLALSTNPRFVLVGRERKGGAVKPRQVWDVCREKVAPPPPSAPEPELPPDLPALFERLLVTCPTGRAAVVELTAEFLVRSSGLSEGDARDHAARACAGLRGDLADYGRGLAVGLELATGVRSERTRGGFRRAS